MKVLLRKNVSRLGEIGDVVEVKRGYARNYLLPQGLAVQPTKANIRSVEIAKQRYLEELARQRSELAAKAAVVDGRQLTIPARANEEGHLYGSIGPAQIVAALAEENVFIEPEHVAMEHPIRELGESDVPVRFAEGITATVHLSVVGVDQGAEAGELSTGTASEASAGQADPEQQRQAGQTPDED